MSPPSPASLSYAAAFTAEPAHIGRARRRGEQFGAATPIGPDGGAALRMLAAAAGARDVLEVGTGGGSSGLWLLGGMPADGVLTTIDVNGEHQRAVAGAYAAAGVDPGRVRLVTGDAADVMARMADGAFDMVVVDADKPGYPAYAAHAVRLLRRGGVLALDNMLWADRVADPAARDAATTTLRDVGVAIRDDAALRLAVLPVGDGLLVAVKR